MTPTRGATVDVLVVGAGPAGLSAAIAAAERGKRVLVLDQGLRPGGQIWRHRDPSALPMTARAMFESARNLGIKIASRARVIDARGPGELLVDFNGRIDRQAARALVLATGAKERFNPFPGWTLPGVVGIGGLQALIKSGVSVAGAHVVIAGSGPLLFPVAATAAQAGAELLLVGEQATLGSSMRFGLSLVGKPSAIAQGIRYRLKFRKTKLRNSCWVTRAEGVGRVTRAHVQAGAETIKLDCDWLAVGLGLMPNVELAQLLGCAVVDNAIDVDADQRTSVPGVYAAGECTGVAGDASAIAEGEVAGAVAAGDEATSAMRRKSRAGRAFGKSLARAFAPRDEVLRLADAETVICRCEDVRRGEIDAAWTQRQAKLWTRVGMGECQGAVCGPACSALFGWQMNAPRPPLGAPLLEQFASNDAAND